MPRMALAWLLAALLAWPVVVHGEPPAPGLSASTGVARDGSFQLRWSLDDADVVYYRIEEAIDPEFREAVTLYQGADRATVISGRGDGTFHYRVRATLADGGRSAWSEPEAVEVAHHPLWQALALFSLGALVFLATVALIVAGTRAERREAGGAA
jgi:hypothetical protein